MGWSLRLREFFNGYIFIFILKSMIAVSNYPFHSSKKLTSKIFSIYIISLDNTVKCVDETFVTLLVLLLF